MTRDTVMRETPARCATSTMVAPRGRSGLLNGYPSRRPPTTPPAARTVARAFPARGHRGGANPAWQAVGDPGRKFRPTGRRGPARSPPARISTDGYALLSFRPRPKAHHARRDRRLGAVVHVEFPHHGRHVRLDRGLGDSEVEGDLLVEPPGIDPFQDLQLGRCEFAKADVQIPVGVPSFHLG